MGLLRGSIEMAKAAGRDVAINMAVAALAAVFALLGGGFLTAAAYQALSAHFGTVIACVMMGAGFLAVAALIVVVRFAGSKAPAPRPPAPAPIDPMAQTAFEIGYGLGQALFGRRRG